MDWHRGIVVATSDTGFAVLGPILDGSIVVDLSVLIQVGAVTFALLSPTMGLIGQSNAAAHRAGAAIFSEGAIQLNDRPGLLLTTENSIALDFRVRMHRRVVGQPRYMVVAVQNFSGLNTMTVFASVRALDRVGLFDGGGTVVPGRRALSAGPGIAGLGDFRNG